MAAVDYKTLRDDTALFFGTARTFPWDRLANSLIK